MSSPHGRVAMNMHRRFPLVALALFGGLASVVRHAAAEETPRAVTAQQAEFFESKVRPLLANRCQECHGSDVQEADLRLDAPPMAIERDGGPVIVPGDPGQSRLIEVVRYEADVQMPPDGKLSDEEVAALVAWVDMGAPWPAGSAAHVETMDERMARARAEHWAFQPVVPREPPSVKNTAWSANPIDAFVLARLEAQALAPSPPADRRTLLRRATFDLIGLPPTYDQVQAFLDDKQPGAFERAVDRLLASPQYGERWGRHWLDVARYADTKGYVFTQERRYPFSYTYRDYVVRAFNEDLPYDRFILEQLAADQLDLGEDNRALAAMGFLTLGRRFMFNTQDIIDDRIDVVSRGLMALTVSCARCHDHKFDPVPTADYYSLYGVFASSVEPDTEPLIGQAENSEAYAQYERELSERERAFAEFRDVKYRELLHELRASAGEYLAQVAREQRPDAAGDEAMLSLGPGELRPRLVRRWREYVEQSAAARPAVFGPWHAFAALGPDEFAAKASQVAAGLPAKAAAMETNRLVAEALAGQPPTSMLDVADRYGELLASVDRMWDEALEQASASEAAVDRLDDPAAEELRQVLYGRDSPAVVPVERAQRLFARDVRDQLTALRRKVEELKVDSPAAPPRAMALVDAPSPTDPQVFIRGNAGRPGETVPRQFLAVLSPADRRAFERGSGRLELAQAIASPENPLTSRVLVNRVWLHHFGEPLVETASDFGLRSEPPTHPELLDYLAATFVEQGWSLKKLHRLIMLSSAYQQASGERAEAAAVDPENRLLWRMNRRRLEFEPIRDSYLAVAHQLDPALGGRPVDLWARPFSPRRTIYAFIDRQDLPGIFRSFDFANPDVSNDERPRTTVPQQALFAMNSPFVLEQARALAARQEVAGQSDPEHRVQALYRLALARPAEPAEVQLALRFVAEQPQDDATKLGPWEMLAQVLLSTNEFIFVD
ncbi:MAG: PSD1 and planctomycete cytochrome C domain-containing protein [Pirellulales bacterium]